MKKKNVYKPIFIKTESAMILQHTPLIYHTERCSQYDMQYSNVKYYKYITVNGWMMWKNT